MNTRISEEIPERFLRTPTNENRLLHVVKDYNVDFENNVKSGKGMFLCGKTDSGKSHSTAWLLMHNDYKYFFWKTPLRLVKDSMDDEKWKWLFNCGVLVIDDLDKINLTGNSNQYAIEQIYDLIEYRHNQKMRSTFFTTNKEMKELEDIYGEWTVRRIVEGSDGFIYQG